MDRPQHTIAELAQLCGGRFLGSQSNASRIITGVSAVHDSNPDSITWITEPRHAKLLAECRAAAIIGTEALLAECPRGIVVADPEEAIARVLDRFEIPQEPPLPGIHPQAIIHPSARVAPDAAIGAFCIIHAGATIGSGSIIHEGCSIGREVAIGSRCVFYDRVTIYDRAVIGDRVILHSGVVVGADGFGFIFRDGKHRKLAHIGNVIIEDDVEIGPNSVVDRGKLGPTRVGRGSKIDALVMIGHNVQIGPLCVLAGQAGLSGSVRLGAGVAVGGQAGFSHGITVGNKARIGAQSGVMTEVPDGETVLGSPAQTAKAEMRSVAHVRKLQKLYDDVAELTRRVKELEAAANHRNNG